jgi:hypothetical protein
LEGFVCLVLRNVKNVLFKIVIVLNVIVDLYFLEGFVMISVRGILFRGMESALRKILLGFKFKKKLKLIKNWLRKVFKLF